MAMNRRNFLRMSAALTAAGMSPSLFAATKEQFTIYGAPAMPSVTIAVAAAQGKLAKQADVALEIWRSPDQLVGMVNILTNGITQLMCKGGAITSPQELVGKKILVPFKNDMPDIVLQALLKKLNIDINKVEITYAATPTEAIGLFLLKDFHAAILPEPMASAVVQKAKIVGTEIVRGFDLVKEWGQAFNTKPLIPMAGIIANEEYFHAHKAEFDLFHQDLSDALNWMMANRKSAAEIGANYLPAPEAAIEMGLDGARLTVTKASELKNEIMQFYETLMEFNPKLLGGKLPDDKFFLA